jgi:phosphoglycerol transferase MdoB-like AlkP superfamily enzyme
MKQVALRAFERLHLRSAYPFYVPLSFYLVLTNVPAQLASLVTEHGFPHGVFNLEFVLIGLASLFLSRSIVLALLVWEMLADFVYNICSTYSFSLDDLLASLHYVPLLAANRLAFGSGALLCGLVICAVVAQVRPESQHRRLLAGSLIGFAVLTIAGDMVSGQNLLVKRDSTWTSQRLVRVPTLVLSIWNFENMKVEARARTAVNEPMNSASANAPILQDGSMPAKPDIVFVVLESWGLLRDSGLQKTMVEGYSGRRITARYGISMGTTDFQGLTVQGEVRELCHSTLGLGVLRASQEALADCLPDVLGRIGYETTAVHGFDGQMFHRDRWYPTVGFQRSYFRPDLQGAGLPTCDGAFPGICDSAIAGWISRTLLVPPRKRPQFVYWVTLNSHLPVPAHPDLAPDRTCELNPALSDSASLCSWFRLVQNVHGSVQEMAVSATRPTVFVVVGDHAPPFGDPELREMFSRHSVPYIVLTPK